MCCVLTEQMYSLFSLAVDLVCAAFYSLCISFKHINYQCFFFEVWRRLK
jgi:hypothetical protein